MNWRHVMCISTMCSSLVVLALSLTLNYFFISGKIRMEQPNEMLDLMNNYQKNKK